MLRKSMIAAAALAASLMVAAGPAGASSGILLHTNLQFVASSRASAAPNKPASGVASLEFRMDGLGWNASTHNVNLAPGSYTFYVVASGAGGIFKVTRACSFTLKLPGTGQCGGARLAIAPNFSPTSIKPVLLNGSSVMVANGKFM